MSDKKKSSNKSSSSSSGFGGFVPGASSAGDSSFFLKSAGQNSTSTVDVSGDFKAGDFESMLERYADSAFSKLVADVERKHSDKFLYIEQAQKTIASPDFS